jgi:hypothetical protein
MLHLEGKMWLRPYTFQVRYQKSPYTYFAKSNAGHLYFFCLENFSTLLIDMIDLNECIASHMDVALYMRLKSPAENLKIQTFGTNLIISVLTIKTQNLNLAQRK